MARAATRQFVIGLLAGVLGTLVWSGPVSAELVLCKSFLGFVRAREGRCRRRETLIPIPQGSGDTNAATECGEGEVLLGDGSCVALAPSALCGNGIVDTGEQCDQGLENGPEEICTDKCVWNCPCDFTRIPLSAWSSPAGATVVDGPRWVVDADQCGILLDYEPSQVPLGAETVALIFRQHEGGTCGITSAQDGITDGAEQIGLARAAACAVTLVDYKNQLITDGLVIGNGAANCPFDPRIQ